MRHIFSTLGLVLFAAGGAVAQPSTRPPVVRGDLWAGVGSSSFEDTDPATVGGYDEWTHGFLRGIGGGYYWTDHLKTEIEVSWAGEREVHAYVSERRLGAPGGWLYTTHRFSNVTGSLVQAYQFGRNAMLHPFLLAGVDVDRERRLTDRPAESTTTVRARPFAGGGIKAYFTERTYLRTDLRLGLRNGVDHAAWTIGLGVDFWEEP